MKIGWFSGHVSGRIHHVNVLLGLTAAIASYRVFKLLWVCGDGFDLTDEGYYLNSIQHAGSYLSDVTQFGHFFHRVSAALQASIPNLRRLNILFTLGLGCLLSNALLRLSKSYLNDSNSKVMAGYWSPAFLTLTLGSGALAIFSEWLPTPNYNTLAFQGVLLALSGFIYSLESRNPLASVGALISGVATVLVFIAKPTSAAALIPLLSLGVLLGNRKFALRFLVIAGTSSLLLLLLWSMYVASHPLSYVNFLQTGAEQAAFLSGDYGRAGVFRADRLPGAKALLLTAVFLSVYLKLSGTRSLLASGVLSIVLLITFETALTGIKRYSTSQLTFLILLLSPVFLIIFQRISKKRPFSRSTGTLDRRLLAVVCLLALAPLSFAFGTNNNLWMKAAQAGWLWGLAGLLLTLGTQATLKAPALSTLFVGIQLVTSFNLNQALQYPYRQPSPLPLRDSGVQLKIGGSLLTVHRDFASYLGGVENHLRGSGFSRGRAMIDFTGHSPGIIAAVGGFPLGRPWLLGGYPGSVPYAISALAAVPCTQLARAWLLVEEGGPLALPAELILAKFGLSLATDFQEVGKVDLPRSVSTFSAPSQVTIYGPLAKLTTESYSCAHP